MIHPTPRCALVFAAGLPLALAPALLGPELWIAWALLLGVLALGFAIDAALCPTLTSVRPEVLTPEHVALGEKLAIALEFHAPRRAGRIEWTLDLDERCEPPGTHVHAIVARVASATRVELAAIRRGRALLRALWMRWSGPLGLARRVVRVPLDRAIDIGPDVRGAHRAALRFLADEQRSTQGLRSRTLGEGSEFESLREYVAGMDHRRIHWKASARHRSPLCTQYRAERDHQLLVALDTGHLMSEPIAGRSKLDHFVQAALALAWVSLRVGDRVGFAAFDQELRAFAAPARGTALQQRFEHAAAGLEPRAVETNFTRGVLEISRRLKRRSLIVWFTDFVDSVSAELMLKNLGNLARRHLVLFVALEDPAARAVAEKEPSSQRELCDAAVMGSFLHERREVLEKLRRLGVLVVSAPPEQIGPRLLQRYLEIHARELVA